jgi:hypothetical protein
VVVGIDVFRAYFAEDDESFVLIGGVAAEMWLARAELPFRVTGRCRYRRESTATWFASLMRSRPATIRGRALSRAWP